MPELTLFLAYVRTDLCTDVRSDRPETRNIGGQTQKAEHHRHGDTLPLLVLAYRSAYSRRRTSCKQKTYPNPFS